MSAPSWQVLPDPKTGYAVGPAITHADTGRTLSTGFAGRGLLFPFRRDGKADFASGIGVELTRSAVALVLGTMAGSSDSHGELPWRTEFGSLLHFLRLRVNSPALAELARSRVATALANWIPTVRLRRIEVRKLGESLTLVIGWDLLGAAGGRVLVPGLETSVALG